VAVSGHHATLNSEELAHHISGRNYWGAAGGATMRQGIVTVRS
jgi:hypothetical protein